MILFKHITTLKKHIEAEKLTGKKVGFVPTMGALHQGHISLIEYSRKDSDLTVCSIFVNPTQFNNKEDFEKYPITIDTDIDKLEAAGCDILFLPSADEIYPLGQKKEKQYDLGYLETFLDGAFRPGHFQGVCQVVERLLQIVEPQHLYLGQKDYQQCMVITRLAELMNWKTRLHIHICPTLREPDGLAMSSRNMRLSEDKRIGAASIYEMILQVKKGLAPENFDIVLKLAKGTLELRGFDVDYFEIADATTLALLKEWDGKRKIVVLVAAFWGGVRLIDNMVLN